MRPQLNPLQLRQQLAIVEDVFGASWLKKKSKKIGTPVRLHPIVQLWVRANHLLTEMEKLRSPELDDDMIAFLDLAGIFAIARTLEGYKEVFTKRRLKDADDWDKEYYVAYVGVWAKQSGYAVQFLLPSTEKGIKTPDLRLQSPSGTLYAECKRKQRYIRPDDASAAWEVLQENLLGLRKTVSGDYDVIVICIGILNAQSLEKITRAAEYALRKDAEGIFPAGIPDCSVLIRRIPAHELELAGICIPTWQNPGAAIRDMTVGHDGKAHFGPMVRCTLYVIDAHRLAQILNSFQEGRSQIPGGSSGLIYIDVDTTGIAPGDHDIYFGVMSDWIKKEFTENSNSRISAVVLTGTEVLPSGIPRHRRHGTIIRNPFCNVEYKLPGEQ